MFLDISNKKKNVNYYHKKVYYFNFVMSGHGKAGKWKTSKNGGKYLPYKINTLDIEAETSNFQKPREQD